MLCAAGTAVAVPVSGPKFGLGSATRLTADASASAGAEAIKVPARARATVETDAMSEPRENARAF
jgi:hypothetical protein